MIESSEIQLKCFRYGDVSMIIDFRVVQLVKATQRLCKLVKRRRETEAMKKTNSYIKLISACHVSSSRVVILIR